MNIDNIPATIEKLMGETMSKVAQAASKHDLPELEMLTKRASELKQMKEQIASIQHRLLTFVGQTDRKPQAILQTNFGKRELIIEVTHGMINQNLLTLTEPINRGQIRIGEDLAIEALPSGEKFRSVVMGSGKKLQERGCIGKFYRQANVQAGDYVTLREISHGQWQLSKRSQNN